MVGYVDFQIMSSRGAITDTNFIVDGSLVFQSTLLVDVRSCDVGICWKAPLRQWRFREIATLRQNQSRLAMTLFTH